MRKVLFALVGMTGLALAGGAQAAARPALSFPASSVPAVVPMAVDAPHVQTVQYGPGYRAREWRRHEEYRRWRHRQWRRHHGY